MVYHYSYEICGLAIALILLYDYRNKQKYLRPSIRMFNFVIHIFIMECSLNIVSSILISFKEFVPIWLNSFIACLFFILQATLAFTFSKFVLTGVKPKSTPQFSVKILILIPYIINLVFSILSPFTGSYYYFSADGAYHQGPLAIFGYLFFLISTVTCIWYMYTHRKYLLQKDLNVVWTCSAFMFAGTLIQFFNRTILTIDLGTAIVLLYLYMTLENPNDYIDKLTGCGNATSFQQCIDERSESAQTYSVIYLDIVRFRYFNQFYGNSVGDDLLRNIYNFLNQTFPNENIYRIRADLFAVILERPMHACAHEINQIIDRFQEPWNSFSDHPIRMNTSLFVCESPSAFTSHNELEKLLLTMKERLTSRQANNVMYSTIEMANSIRSNERIEQILRHAVNTRNVEVYFQPIVDTNTGDVVSMEALARLVLKNGETISPAEFIPIAEKNGDIIKLGLIVLDKTCRFIENHILTDPNNTITCVHVNLSAMQCEYADLYNDILKVLHTHDIPPSMIQFEMTESTMIQSQDDMHNLMKKLSQLGIQFALDDYGTGYSNISYLIQFPFDKTKFDRGIVQSCFTNPQAFTIVQNEFTILTKLGKEIILEGVETKEQVNTMMSHGIHLFQGYYFSKPLPEAECIAYLSGTNN